MKNSHQIPNISPIIEEEFFSKETKIHVRVAIFGEFLKLNFSNKNEINHQVKDIIGCYIDEPYALNDHAVTLNICTFPKQDGNKREKIVFQLSYDKYNKKFTNLKKVVNFKKHIDHLIVTKDQRPFLVFLNPNSGSGKASKLMLYQVVSMWKLANVKFKIIETNFANHAKEVSQKIEVGNYRGIIVISGDGLVFEVLNGLLSRPDWKDAIKVPIGQIAAGSANGLSSSIAFLSNENFMYDKIENFATLMSFMYAKSNPVPMDLVSIQLQNQTFINSFLNVEWAMVADVDFESEQFRFLGGFRFVLGAIRRLMNLRKYRGRISFLPADEMKNYTPKDSNLKVLRNTGNYSSEELEEKRLVNPELNIEYRFLKPLDEKVPNDWLTIEDSFVMFAAVNLPLMGIDFIISPETKLNDGSIMLTFVRDGAPKLRILELFNDAAKGKFLENKYIEFVKVKAFRLEPLDGHECGNIMIDGERVPYGPIQGEVLPQFARALQ